MNSLESRSFAGPGIVKLSKLPLNKAPTSKFMQRKQMSGLCVKLPSVKPGFRYDDIASAPVLPSGYNPFAEAFKNANAAQTAASQCRGTPSGGLPKEI